MNAAAPTRLDWNRRRAYITECPGAAERSGLSAGHTPTLGKIVRTARLASLLILSVGLLLISSLLVPTAVPSMVGTAVAGATGCTDPPGAPGELRFNPGTGDFEVCRDVSDPRTGIPDYQWMPLRPDLGPKWQQANPNTGCVAHWTVTAPEISTQPLTLVMAFGDGTFEGAPWMMVGDLIRSLRLQRAPHTQDSLQIKETLPEHRRTERLLFTPRLQALCMVEELAEVARSPQVLRGSRPSAVPQTPRDRPTARAGQCLDGEPRGKRHAR